MNLILFKNVTRYSTTSLLTRRLSILSTLRARRQELHAKTPGCFGLPGLHRAEDWQNIANACVRDCVALADSIRSQSAPSTRTIQIFDDLSDKLCKVLDAAELCRNVHPRPEFVEAANNAYLRVSTVIQHLNADTSIYEPLNVLYDQHQIASRCHTRQKHILSEEDAVMTKSLKEDFERGGIALKTDEKNQLIKLQQEINILGTDFVSRDVENPASVIVHANELRKLPHSLRSVASPSLSNAGYEIPASSTNIKLILKWCHDSSLRERVYRLSNNADPSKMNILDKLLQKRRELSSILGHESYAHLMFSDRLASSPSEVLSFLNNLSDSVRDSALREKSVLENAKLRVEPHTSHDGKASIHGWDRSFYIGRSKALEFNISSAEILPFFSLQSCLSALSGLVESIFGIRLNRMQANPGEVWHPSVEKLEAVDGNGQIVGYIFLDLYPREGKYTHAAHFSITCGRQPSETCAYQVPVVALVCNFGTDFQSGHPLLSMSEYETLFHEFGHSLHSILSRTKYQHLSGTRVTTDLVEVPSHVFEYFAWDPRVISKYARHFRTGEPLPTRTVKSLCASRNGFVATDVQMQTLFSAMDLHFHGPSLSNGTLGTFEKLQQELTVYKPDKRVAIPLTFHHIVGYGAGYYSYVFARILSAQIWYSIFERNPFSREGGTRLRHGLLALGASRDGSSLIRELLQEDVTCHAFLRSIGVDIKQPTPNLKLPLR